MMPIRMVRSLLCLVLVGLTPVATTWAEPDLPPTPTAAPSPALPVQLRTAYTAFLRAEPDWRHDADREVLARGTEVVVLAVVPDGTERLGGYWYHVQAFPAGHASRDGWLHSTVVYLPPAQLAQLGTTLPPASTPAASPSEPPATGALAVAPASGATTGLTTVVPLALRVCYDLHANKTCDVDEGIAGVRVYGTDAATGQVLVTAVTDATGVAQFRWRAPAADAHARLTLTVPYFEEVRTVTSAQAAIDPVLITALAPIPAWLP